MNRIDLKNTRGIELALNSVVILIILLIALIVIVGFFLGSTGKIFAPIADMLTGSSEQTNKKCIEARICPAEETTTGLSILTEIPRLAIT